jgi:hypothetical protein
VDYDDGPQQLAVKLARIGSHSMRRALGHGRPTCALLGAPDPPVSEKPGLGTARPLIKHVRKARPADRRLM